MFLHYTLEIGKCQLVGGIFCNFHIQSHMFFVQIEYIYEKTNLDIKKRKEEMACRDAYRIFATTGNVAKSKK